MTNYKTIRHAIEKECQRISLTDWCENWEFTVDDFYKYLDVADKALCAHQEPNEPLCGLTNAQLGRLVRNSYIEGYEDGQNGKPSLEKIEPLTLKRFEAICESVHNGWWEEKKRQGVTKHPDMLPYSELAEEVKEYDRVTVRRVLDALGLVYRHTPEQED